MRPNQALSTERLRQGRSLAAFTLLLVATFLLAGCGGNDGGNKNGGNKGGDTTVPSKTMRSLGDTPIVISGGSIHLDLNNGTFQLCSASTVPACPPMTAGNAVYWAAGKISSGYYYNDNENSGDDQYPISMTSAENMLMIKIVGKLQAEEGQIIISNDRANNRVLVEFDEAAKFKPRRAGSPMRINKKFKIENFKVKDGNLAEKDYATEATWPNGNKVTIELIGTP
jgi:hypothetical protein